MQPHAVDGRWRRARSPAGFSLAEMMIALAILGMGLLVIGAALPIGIRYTRASVNKATGEAAAEYALDVIEQNVCLRNTILNAGGLKCEPGLFQPRNTGGEFVADYEPVIKVRPLHVRAIDGNPASQFYGQQELTPSRIRSEEVAYRWMLSNSFVPTECELDPGAAGVPWMRWALPSIATVYPPITSDEPFDLNSFVSTVSGKYERREVRSPWSVPAGSETLKALDRRIVWTAFYRRVSYEAGSDPALYEFIVVALRVPGAGYRFPVQEPNDGGLSDSDGPGTSVGNGEIGEMTVTGMGSLGPSGGYGSASAGASSGGRPGGDGNAVGGASDIETAAPIPWLVSFRNLPSPPNQVTPFDSNGYPLDAQGYAITMGSPNAPATLRFTCRPERSGLFPVGSMFIPARNDDNPNLLQGNNEPRVGFGPPAPAALPVYEVTERPDDYTVIVKFNGFFPMRLNPVNGRRDTPDGVQWPVWVIPPAFTEYQGGAPVAPDQCQIVAVARRYMRLREVP
ncbi:MAG: prepilin-type N-terminal cleavage/methylation domain-containing protein [Planctomycetota bacterium]